MTLIIKELIIRGIVASDPSTSDEPSLDQEANRQALEEMKKEIIKECSEKVIRILEKNANR